MLSINTNNTLNIQAISLLTGTFSHQFSVAETYHYWSGKLDQTGFSMKGVITVNEKQSLHENITVLVTGFEALYDKNTGIILQCRSIIVCSDIHSSGLSVLHIILFRNSMNSSSMKCASWNKN